MRKLLNFFENKEKIIKNAYIIIFILSSLATLTIYTQPLYELTIYAVVIIGIIIGVAFSLINKVYVDKKNWVLFIFLSSYVVTIVIIFDENLFTNVFVLMCIFVYFYIITSFDNYTKEEIKRINIKIMGLIILTTFVMTTISFAIVWCSMAGLTVENFGYILRGQTLFMMSGIYKGTSSLAIVAGLSILASVYMLKVVQDSQQENMKKILLVGLCLNVAIQILALFMSSSITGLLAFLSIIFIGNIYYLNFRLRIKKSMGRILLAILISILITSGFYLSGNFMKSSTVKIMIITASEFLPEGVQIIESDEILTDRDIVASLETGTGRYDIWKHAIKIWAQAPIFGSGYGSFEYTIQQESEPYTYTNTHNGYIKVLVNNGIIGFVTIMVFGVIQIVGIFKSVILVKDTYKTIILLGLMYLLMIALAQETFILDRGLNSLLICIFLGQLITMTKIEKFGQNKKNEETLIREGK